MLSLEFEREGDPREVIVLRKDRPVPRVEDDEVLVRALARPINAGELLYVEGKYGVRAERFPARLGIEGMGVVVELGKAVRQAAGARPRDGQRVHCFSGIPRCGTWAEYVSVPAKYCTPLPEAMGDIDGSQVEVAPCTAMAMLEVLGVTAGQWLLQTAASSQVGKNVIELCKARGVRTVNLVRRADHIGELKTLGADEVIVTHERGWQDRVKSLTGPAGVKHALDAVGGELAAEVAALLGDDGCMLIYGLLAGARLPYLDGARLLFTESAVKGFWMDKWSRPNEAKVRRFLDEAIRLTASGVLTFVSTTYDLETQWREAIVHSIQGGKTGRPVLATR